MLTDFINRLKFSIQAQ